SIDRADCRHHSPVHESHRPPQGSLHQDGTGHSAVSGLPAVAGECPQRDRGGSVTATPVGGARAVCPGRPGDALRRNLAALPVAPASSRGGRCPGLIVTSGAPYWGRFSWCWWSLSAWTRFPPSSMNRVISATAIPPWKS